MSKYTHFSRTIFTLAALTLAIGCDSDVTGPRAGGIEPTPLDPGQLTMRVAPLNVVLPLGATYQLTAELVRPDGTPAESIDMEIIWSSSDPNIAQVSEFGLLEARSIGSTVVSAASAEGMGFTTVTVVEAGEIDPPYLEVFRKK
jgi:hypothetical protein